VCGVWLQSALRLTEVLKEREAQTELKRLREASVCGDNKETQAQLREAYEESLRIGLQEKQKARDAKIKCVDFQKAQYETARFSLTFILHQMLSKPRILAWWRKKCLSLFLVLYYIS